MHITLKLYNSVDLGTEFESDWLLKLINKLMMWLIFLLVDTLI